MKWIKYNVLQNTINTGTESKPVYEDILLEKRIGYSAENLAIAQAEAYNGEYTVEEDATPNMISCLPSAFASYLAFAGNVNSSMMSAAFGEGNEDVAIGLGEALAMYGWFKGESKITHPFSALQKILSIGETNRDVYGEIIRSDKLSTLIANNYYARNKFMEVHVLSAIDDSTDKVEDVRTASIVITNEDLLHPFRISYHLVHNLYYNQTTKVFINNVLIKSLVDEDDKIEIEETLVLKNWKDFNITKPGTYTIKAYASASTSGGNARAFLTVYKSKQSYNIIGGN